MYQFQKCMRKILSVRKDQLKMRHSCTTKQAVLQVLNPKSNKYVTRVNHFGN